MQMRGLWEGFMPSWWHKTVGFKQKVVEDSRKLPLSYRKVKCLGAYSSRIKTAARCRLL